MKYYLVASTTCCMVGIEQCRGYIVGPALRQAFEKEFARRIILVSSSALALPGVSYLPYQKASGPFFIFPILI